MLDRELAQIGAENPHPRVIGTLAECLENGDCQRVSFLAAGATRHPDAQLRLSLFRFQKRGQEFLLQRGEYALVSKKMRYADEQIGKKRFDFFLIVAQKTRVVAEPLDAMQRHAPLDPSMQGRMFIGAEIDTGKFFQRKKDATEIIGFLVIKSFRFGVTDGTAEIRMRRHAPDFARDIAWRKNNVDKAGSNRAGRHGVELRALRFLREGEAASRFDRPQTSGAIGARAGKQHPDRARAAAFGE